MLIGFQLGDLLLPVRVENVAVVARQALVDLFLSATEMRLARRWSSVRSATTG